MIKLIKDKVITYQEDRLPYIILEGFPEDATLVAEVIEKNGKKQHYFLNKERVLYLQTHFFELAPEVAIIFVNNSADHIKTNHIELTDWIKFVKLSGETLEVKFAKLQLELNELKSKGINKNDLPVIGKEGMVLMFGKNGQLVPTRLFNKSIQYLNGKTPDNDGVLELKITDFSDFMQYDQARLATLIQLLDAYNERILELEQKITELENPSML